MNAIPKYCYNLVALSMPADIIITHINVLQQCALWKKMTITKNKFPERKIYGV